MIATLSLILAMQDQWISPKTNAELLDEVMTLPEEGIVDIFHWNAFTFMADRYEGYFGGKDEYVLKKSKPAAIDLLVARGADAVPYLASQLGSTQPTKAAFGTSPFSSMFLSALYDPKVREVGVDQVFPDGEEQDALLQHTFCRGDVAFAALGQIVNRWYGRFPAQNTAIGSPPKLPKLRARAEAEWGHLTREGLREVLRKDMLQPDSDDRMTYALCRYRTYFPEDAVRMAVECLKTSYGKWDPVGGNGIQFFFQLMPIACAEIDKICYEMLNKSLKQNHFIIDYDGFKIGVLCYLKDRPGYRAKCFEFARKHANEKTAEGWASADFLKKNKE